MLAAVKAELVAMAAPVVTVVLQVAVKVSLIILMAVVILLVTAAAILLVMAAALAQCRKTMSLIWAKALQSPMNRKQHLPP